MLRCASSVRRLVAQRRGTPISCGPSAKQPLLALPSVLTIPQYIAKLGKAARTLDSGGFGLQARRLAAIRAHYVQSVLQQEGLVDSKRLEAPIVPFQIACSIAAEQLGPEGAARCEWCEVDRYVNVASIKGGGPRTPTVCIVGHIDHGKTTLLDTLQKSSLCDVESGKITQTIRAFTVALSDNSAAQITFPRSVTFVDTPGHKIFAEMRLCGQRAADYVLLLIALDEGIQGQTVEVIEMAIELKKPLIIALNKVDLFDDPRSLSSAIVRILKRLRELGVALFLVDSPAAAMALPPPTLEKVVTGEDKSKRVAVGVCISGKFQRNLDSLLAIFRVLANHKKPLSDHTAALQAVTIESWKKRDEVVISTIVRSGVASKGMPFIADQCYGVIDRLEDSWGKVMAHAKPGEAACVRCYRAAGCPASGTHLIQMDSEEDAQRVFYYRRLLSLFLQTFPSKSHLLRPAGMDCRFGHVGCFGEQAKGDSPYDYKLLYESAAPTDTQTPEELLWRVSQPQSPTKTEEDVANRIRRSQPCFVLLKVDTWHSARLLMREVPRLGTANVLLEVVGVSFGKLTERDLAGQRQLDLVLSYRAPALDCPKAAYALEKAGVPYANFDVYLSLVEYVKAFAVAKQRELMNSPLVDEVQKHHADYAVELVQCAGMKETVTPRSPQALRRLQDP